MKKAVLVILPIIALFILFLGCSDDKRHKPFLLHEGTVTCYQLNSWGDDRIDFSDGAYFHATSISVWDNCTMSYRRESCILDDSKPYKLYFESDYVYYLAPSDVLIPVPQNKDCGCE